MKHRFLFDSNNRSKNRAARMSGTVFAPFLDFGISYKLIHLPVFAVTADREVRFLCLESPCRTLL